MHTHTHTRAHRSACHTPPRVVVVVVYAGFLSSSPPPTPPPTPHTTNPAHHFYRPRTMIIIIMASIAGNIGLAAHMVFGDAGLACYAAFLAVAGVLTYHAVRSLEAVEVFKKKYEAAYMECTKGIEPGSDQLGPKSVLKPDLMQHERYDVDFYIEEANRLFKDFRREVLDVLANAADPTGKVVTILPNKKGREVSECVWSGSEGKHGGELQHYTVNILTLQTEWYY